MRTSAVTLVDSTLLEKYADHAEPYSEPPPGCTLPADFPREEFTADQLVLLEELCFQYTREFILRFFRILATPVDRSGNPTRSSASNIACQAVVLSKLLGLNSSLKWRDLGAIFGVSSPSLMAAKQHTLAMLDRMATRGTRSAADWQALAEIARRQSRLYAMRAAAMRQPKPSTRTN